MRQRFALYAIQVAAELLGVSLLSFTTCIIQRSIKIASKTAASEGRGVDAIPLSAPQALYCYCTALYCYLYCYSTAALLLLCRRHSTATPLAFLCFYKPQP